MSKMSVVIAEDESAYRKALRRTIESTNDIEVVAECGDGQEAFDRATELKPDVLLTDLVMPRMHGSELIKKLARQSPKTCVVVLTIHEEDDAIYEALHAGACGFLLKSATPQDIIEAIRYASRGEAKLTPLVAARLLDSFRRHAPRVEPATPLTLSAREREILRYVAAGMRNRDIARELDITEKTVKNHVSNILRSLNVNSRTEAALAAVRHNLVRA